MMINDRKGKDMVVRRRGGKEMIERRKKEEGLREDVLEVLLNLKEIVFKHSFLGKIVFIRFF